MDFIIHKNILITLTDVENLIKTYEHIRKLKIDTDKKDEPIKILKRRIGKRRPCESIDNYIKRKKREIALDKRERGERGFFIKRN